MNALAALQPVGLPALSVRDLNVTFRSRTGLIRAVRNVSFDVRRGEVFAVIGESGSGKSSMAQAAMGLLPPSATVTGEISLGDMPLHTLSSQARRRLNGERLALISQDALSGLNPCTTVGYQIAETLMVHRGTRKTEAFERAVELLALTGIPAPGERIHHYPHQFSGGMRQRALIAIALALDPEVLIADEPTTALDATVKAQILQLLKRLREQLGMSVLIVTHDMGVVAHLADRMLVMYAGQVVESGAVPDVFAAPAHPYTEALLTAMPRLDRGGAALQAIPGLPPTPGQIPPGCPFHPRCGRSEEICSKEDPPAIVVGADRISLCHFAPEVLSRAARV